MPGKTSFCKKAIHWINQFERVVLRAIEAVYKIASRILLYGPALWWAYQYFVGKH